MAHKWLKLNQLALPLNKEQNTSMRGFSFRGGMAPMSANSSTFYALDWRFMLQMR